MNSPLQPLWTIYEQLVQDAPSPAGVFALWRGAHVASALHEAPLTLGTDAERRVFLLRNPGLDRPTVTHTLVAGVQLLLPGEHAPVHRHSQSGLRVMLSGAAQMTVGERTLSVQPGDLVVLPALVAHGHANTSDEAARWLDVLDVPTVGFLRATFSSDGGTPPSPRTSGGLLLGRDDTALGRGQEHPALGLVRRYRPSPDGGDVLPAIRATQHRLRSFTGVQYRSTSSAVWVVLDGEVEVRIGEDVHRVGPADVFVTPNWTRFALSCPGEATVLCLSDAPLLDTLELLYEEVG